MNYFKYLTALAVICCTITGASQEKPERSSVTQKTAVGAIQGAAMMAAYTPFNYVGNRKIQGLPIQPSRAFRGVAGNIGAVAPITALQVGGPELVKPLLPKNEDGKPNALAEAATIAGVGALSGAISNANEITVQHMGNTTGKGYFQTIREFPQGPRTLVRGAGATMWREALWSATFQKGTGYIKTQIQEAGVKNEAVAIGTAALTTGVAVATFTQPYNMARARMHSDLEGKTYRSTMQTIHTVYKNEGARALFKGNAARTPGVVAALVVGIPVAELATKFIQKK